MIDQTNDGRAQLIFFMLSFSFSKTAAPKRRVTVAPTEPVPSRKEVLSVSSEGVHVQRTQEDLDTDASKILVIPCRRLYEKLEITKSDLREVGHDKFKNLESTSGIINSSEPSLKTDEPMVGLVEANSELSCQPPKKKHMSILMQIKRARDRGEILDAPEQDTKTLDPEDFGWAVMRGMGYDPSTDESPDVTKSTLGNRSKLGIGVKPDSIALPTDRISKNS